MKIDLPIEADEAIRKEVMHLIKGQVLGLVRSEYRKIIEDEIKRVAPHLDKRVGEGIALHLDQAFHEYGHDNKKVNRLINSRILEYLEDHPELFETALAKVMETYTAERIHKLIYDQIREASQAVLNKLVEGGGPTDWHEAPSKKGRS
jgi:hypothetical protein